MWTEFPELSEYSPNWKHFTQLKLKSGHSHTCDDDCYGVTRRRETHEHHTVYYKPGQPVARRQHVARRGIWSDKTPYNSSPDKFQIERGNFFKTYKPLTYKYI